MCNVTGIVYKVEEFRQPVLVRQCFNCQCFGHSAQNCKSKQKCVICGENHSHKGCPKKEVKQPKCANCSGPHVETHIDQLQKQVKDDLRVESQASWEKFCNSISLEADSNESWHKIKNFLKPKGQRDYPTLHHATKVAKTNADKAQLFAESVERHFGIESDHFDSNHFNEVNKFIEDNYQYFYPPEDPDDYRLTWETSTSLWPMSMPKHSFS